MEEYDYDRLLNLMQRSKAVWKDPQLLNLVESAVDEDGMVRPNLAKKLVFEQTGKRKKAEAAHAYARALRDYGWHLVGACARFCIHVDNYPQKIAQILSLARSN